MHGPATGGTGSSPALNVARTAAGGSASDDDKASRDDDDDDDVPNPPALTPRLYGSAADGAHRGLLAIDSGSPLLMWIVWRMVEDPDIGVQSHASDLLHLLLDPETIQPSQRVRVWRLWCCGVAWTFRCSHLVLVSPPLQDEFLEHFYHNNYMAWLMQPFLSSALAVHGPGSVHWEDAPEGLARLPVLTRLGLQDAQRAAGRPMAAASGGRPPSPRPTAGRISMQSSPGAGAGAGDGDSAPRDASPDAAVRVLPVDGVRRDTLKPSSRRVAFTPGQRLGMEPAADKNSKMLLADFLSVCCQAHSFRFKYFTLRNNLVVKVLRVLRYPERHLVLAGLRFLRHCLAIKDDFYYRYLIKHNVFDALFALLGQDDTRYNMVNSAILDLLQYIKAENIKSLVSEVSQKFKDVFCHLGYVTTFQELVDCHAKNVDMTANFDPSLMSSGGGGSGAVRLPEKLLQARRRTPAALGEEEAYFDADDENDAPPSSPWGVLSPPTSPTGALTRPPSPPLGFPRSPPTSPLAAVGVVTTVHGSPLSSTGSPSASQSPPSSGGIGGVSTSPPPRFLQRSSFSSDEDDDDDDAAFFGGRGRGRGRGGGRGRGRGRGRGHAQGQLHAHGQGRGRGRGLGGSGNPLGRGRSLSPSGVSGLGLAANGGALPASSRSIHFTDATSGGAGAGAGAGAGSGPGANAQALPPTRYVSSQPVVIVADNPSRSPSSPSKKRESPSTGTPPAAPASRDASDGAPSDPATQKRRRTN